jgi:hypothetical protein
MDQTEDRARCSVVVPRVFAEGFDGIIGPCRQVRMIAFPACNSPQALAGYPRFPRRVMKQMSGKRREIERPE